MTIKAELIDHMGTDLTVANAARVSFDKASDWVDEVWIDPPSGCTVEEAEVKGWPVRYVSTGRKVLSGRDRSLIQFLARGMSSGEWETIIQEITDSSDRDVVLACLDRLDADPHWTPFGHPQITLRYTVPIFVARQEFKHSVGSVRNEVSRRYVDSEPQFYVPDVWRKRAENKKQGSIDEPVEGYVFTEEGPYGYGVDRDIEEVYAEFIEQAKHVYEAMLHAGAAPEQARMILPQSMLTTYWVTGSLYFFANFYKKRINSHAQKEIQELARQVGDIIEPLFPVSWAALTGGKK